MSSTIMYRPVQPRAGKACHYCRSKKIKCNVALHGPPCANCERHGHDCHVSKSKRGRKPKSFRVDSVAPNRDSVGGLTVLDESSKIRSPFPLPPRTEGSPREKLPGSAMDRIDYTTLHRQQTYASLISDFDVESEETAALRMSVTPTSGETTVPGDVSPCSPPSMLGPCLPDFVQSIEKVMSPRDIEILRLRDALTLPDPCLRNALIRCFIEFVHPSMPVVDLREILGALDGSADLTRPKISILLLQAVLFAAVPFVDYRFLQNAGFSSRKDARRSFYQRAKFLYDMDVEQAQLVAIQSLLFLTHCTEKPGEPKEGWHWLGIAISLAISLGLHLNRPKRPGSEATWRQARRIWWTCYIRDRQMAQYLSRPLRIRDDEFDAAPLSLDDFDLDVFEQLGPFQASFGHEIAFSRAVQTEQATIFIAMSQLCVHLGAAITIHFAGLSRQRRVRQALNEPESPNSQNKLRRDQYTTTAALHHRLSQWMSELPSSCTYRTPRWWEISRQGPSSFVQKAVLHLSFQNTISTLHRSSALPPYQHGRYTNDVEGRESWDHVYRSSMVVSAISRDLHLSNLYRFVPTTVATMQFGPILTLVAQLRQATSPSEQVDTLRNIFHCVKMLEKMRDLYSSADTCLGIALGMLQKVEVDSLAAETDGIYGLRYGEASYDSNKSVTRLDRSVHTSVAAPDDLDEALVDECSGVESGQLPARWPAIPPKDPLQGLQDNPAESPLSPISNLEHGSRDVPRWPTILDEDWLDLVFDFEESQNTIIDPF